MDCGRAFQREMVEGKNECKNEFVEAKGCTYYKDVLPWIVQGMGYQRRIREVNSMICKFTEVT